MSEPTSKQRLQVDYTLLTAIELGERLLVRDAEVSRLSAALEEAEKERDRAYAAINWATGCGDSDFGEGDNFNPLLYWWRRFLTEKAGLVYDSVRQRYIRPPEEAR